MQFGCISVENWLNNWKNLKNKSNKLYNGLWWIKAKYASRFQILKILEIKCNSDVFLLKNVFCSNLIKEMHFCSWKHTQEIFKTDYGELTLHMHLGSKSGQFYRKMQFKCISAQNWSRNWRNLTKTNPKNIYNRLWWINATHASRF